MKKLRNVSLAMLMLEALLWAAGRTFFPLPDWTVRLNGVMMMITMPLLAFAGVRLMLKKGD